MILTKTFIVNGEHRNVPRVGKVYDLGDRIDGAIANQIAKITGDIKEISVPAIEFPTASRGGHALVQIKFDGTVKKSGPKGGR